MTYRPSLGTIIRTDLEVEALDKRRTGEAELEEAHRKCLRLLDPDLPAREDSLVVRGNDGRVLLAAFSHHEQDGTVHHDDIPVRRFQYFISPRPQV